MTSNLEKRVNTLEQWVENERSKRLSISRTALTDWFENSEAASHKTSTSYWTEHTVVHGQNFATEADSLNSLTRRFLQYPGYRSLMDLGDLAGKAVLDFGCGPGHDLVEICITSTPKRLVGVDVSPSALQIARNRLALHSSDAELVLIDESSRLPDDDESFDIILCTGVLMHCVDVSATLRELFRVLKPGGFIKIMVYNTASIWYHLYCGYILRISEGIGSDLSTPDVFKVSTDGPWLPVNNSWEPQEFIRQCESLGFTATHLGNAPSVFELKVAPRRFEALSSTTLEIEHLEFIASLYDTPAGPCSPETGVAGIDGCFLLQRA